ncbi:MAG: NAD-dependent epimerase/dehydratase family protein [Magnetococcales bacterium]|nr:NAD-dependent epimerase/dehydratase family protein [Magnetococcales bacterium]
MNYSQANVLITGGLGLIGSHLARHLIRQGARVTIVDALLSGQGGNLWNIRDIQGQVDLLQFDIRDTHALRECIPGHDVIFNLASQTSHWDSMTAPHADLDINVLAQLKFLELCLACNPLIRIVFTSTRQVHGRPNHLPIDESHPLQPVDFNGIHKVTCEHYHRLFHEFHGMPITILRLTNTYGNGMRIIDSRLSFLGFWIRLLLEGKSLPIYGDGGQLRDFNHVDDCVEALLLAGMHPKAIGQTYLLGGNEVVSMLELGSRMAEWFGGACHLVPYPCDQRKIDIGSVYCNHLRISEDLNWHPRLDLKTGLTKTMDYYRRHFSLYLGTQRVQ